jgi:hypothetical protein
MRRCRGHRCHANVPPACMTSAPTTLRRAQALRSMRRLTEDMEEQLRRRWRSSDSIKVIQRVGKGGSGTVYRHGHWAAAGREAHQGRQSQEGGPGHAAGSNRQGGSGAAPRGGSDGHDRGGARRLQVRRQRGTSPPAATCRFWPNSQGTVTACSTGWVGMCLGPYCTRCCLPTRAGSGGSPSTAGGPP